MRSNIPVHFPATQSAHARQVRACNSFFTCPTTNINVHIPTRIVCCRLPQEPEDQKLWLSKCLPVSTHPRFARAVLPCKHSSTRQERYAFRHLQGLHMTHCYGLGEHSAGWLLPFGKHPVLALPTCTVCTIQVGESRVMAVSGTCIVPTWWSPT